MQRLISALGLITLLLLTYALSENRKKINWRTVLVGIFLQISLGVIVLKSEFGMAFFTGAKSLAVSILSFTEHGYSFVFGPLINFPILANAFGGAQHAFIFATFVLPTIIFISSVMSLLYHLGIMQKIVQVMAYIMIKLMKTTGAESLSCAANVFAGQTEAPLVVRPYLKFMTRSELLALMTGGMATVAGGVLAAYVGMGIDAGHLLAASVMAAPSALVCAKLLIPETEESKTSGMVKLDETKTTSNAIDAIATGAADGLRLALNVGAMLLAFISIMAMFNAILIALGGAVGIENFSLERILGWIFSPFAFLIGIPWAEATIVGKMLGKKLIINEFVAYTDLVQSRELLSSRSFAITTYALCGFSNFSSIGIQVGGISALEPSLKKKLASLGFKALLGGTISCMLTACVAGIFL